jgi:hypothetical protein
MNDACFGLALFGHIRDRHELRGPVAKHGDAPISEDVDPRPSALICCQTWLGPPPLK